MRWDGSVSVPETSKELAQWIALFRRPNSRQLLLNATTRVGMNRKGDVYQPRSDHMPEWFAAGWDDLTLVLLDGATLIWQGNLYMAACDGGDFNAGYGGCYTDLGNLAGFVQEGMQAAGIESPPRMIVAGHSYGGAIGNALAGLNSLSRPFANDSFASFGAPRSGGQLLAVRTQQMDIARWMNAEDCVPLLPPRLGICRLAEVGRNGRDVLQWQFSQHVAGGRVLHADGDITHQELPPSALIAPNANLATWLVSLPFASASVHSIQTYIARLETHIVHRGPLPPEVTLGSPMEERTHSNLGDVTRQQAEDRVVLAERAKGQSTPQVIIPPGQAFWAEKQGLTWVTKFGGSIVAVGPDRRRATRLAREGNEFLKRLPRQANVDPQALSEQFVAFLALAATPGGGFVPPINIES